MKNTGRVSFSDLLAFLNDLKPIVENTFLKNIYHYQGYWEFKFTKISIVVLPGYHVFVGNFIEREKDLHSICTKLRKELRDEKILSIEIFPGDRTFYFEFRNFYLVFEMFAKGNLILLNKEKEIIVLTRVYNKISHGNNYHLCKYEWKLFDNHKVFMKNDNEYELGGNIPLLEANALLWTKKYQNLFRVKEKKEQVMDPIHRQIGELQKKIEKCWIQIQETDANDFEKIGQIHEERKKLENKLTRAREHHQMKKKKKPTSATIYQEIKSDRWYHEYHWWKTKNNLLVVGGRNADQNEKLVKNYLRDQDYYFHSEQPGSGSFIMFNDNNFEDLIIDIVDTCKGVLCFSHNWKLGILKGNVYYVKGHQVSKSAPVGEYVSKGSFMIYGKKNFIKVDTLQLGYCMTGDKELMLAPYDICNRYTGKMIKLIPRTGKKGNSKDIVKKIKEVFHLQTIPNVVYIFSHPCIIFVKN